jgi:hypothetical protein
MEKFISVLLELLFDGYLNKLIFEIEVDLGRNFRGSVLVIKRDLPALFY